MNIYSSVYSGKNTKNVNEDRNCIQLDAMFLVNTEGSENPYYVREMAVLDDETVFVNCSQGQYSYDTAIYKISNGVQELYYTSDIEHYRMQVDFNGNLYFFSIYKVPEGDNKICIVRIDKNKNRTILLIEGFETYLDFIVSDKAGKIFLLVINNYLQEHSLSDASLLARYELKSPDSYNGSYSFDVLKLFLRSDGGIYVYGNKSPLT